MIQVKEFVVTDLSRKGSGQSVISPLRSVLEVYTKDGELVAYHDSQGNYSVEDLIAFAEFCMSKIDLSIEDALIKWKN